jgi:hypothetical protein
VATEPTPKDQGRGRRSHLIAGRGDTLVGSSPARWPPDWSLLSCSPSPRSSRPRNVPSPALCCAGSPWAGRCWRCSRSGSPSSRSDGRRRRRCSWEGGPAPGGGWRPGGPGAQLGVAPGHAGVGRLEGRLCPSTASAPGRTLAAVSRDRGAGAGLDRWRLPDPGCSSRCQGLPDAWAIDRRGRTPPAPELHRRRLAHRGAGAGRWRDVVESWVDRAGRRPGHPGLRL